MKMMLDEFKIESDERQFIVLENKPVQAGKFTKPENVGRDNWKEIAYFTSFESLVKYVCTKIVLKTDDLKDAVDKIDKLMLEVKKIQARLGID